MLPARAGSLNGQFEARKIKRKICRADEHSHVSNPFCCPRPLPVPVLHFKQQQSPTFQLNSRTASSAIFICYRWSRPVIHLDGQMATLSAPTATIRLQLALAVSQRTTTTTTTTNDMQILGRLFRISKSETLVSGERFTILSSERQLEARG